ncbi:tetratricopeptide (TPR) repeat protein [Spinactinospora alkalitolerans]|uniref:Tetratricopeptide (TPR) repeat protein n=2 Tax=Spinactinospora alkalitolerans TaxID=687207 RepID=A0A852U524_9ACTN|nr:tetratricopeptide repeat protein [Spinactinospora alkalitolerans]NYE50612.1 tetratricopeptide (TPR) repeat protein [Spinactinospora alkalitolerans]
MAVTGFVNRRAEIARLDGLLSSPEGGSTGEGDTAVVVSAIGGAPGIGKTALALHWAHRVRSRYPDGDLYVNLRGHGPGPRLDTSEALGSLLQALGVPPGGIPLDLDGRAALYRSRLDHRRMLILIDDAVSAEQVRPLLPASPGCLVLVTSRSTLSGLVAREGARRMTLDTLSTDEALALLRSTVGARRIDAEPEAARDLVAHCARLPLALRILAERLIDRPDASLGDMVADLAAEDRRLDALGTADDELSDVRAVFSASYAALPAEAARLFRCLGLHPGTDFGAAACAASAGLSVREALPLLDRLTAASLLQRVGHDRYRLHDLLRLYAVERFRTDEPPGKDVEVLRLLVRWYLTTARNAVRAMTPNFRLVGVPDGGARTEPIAFDTTDAALTWFEQERANLVGSVRAALDHRLHDLAWRLPTTVCPLFELHRHWHEWRRLNQWGLDAARALDHRHGQARNLLGLADAEWLLGNADTALEHYEAALAASRDVGDGWIEGFALRQLGAIRLERGDIDGDGARALILRGIDAFRRAGERRGEGMALLSLAECERTAGRFDDGLAYCRTAIGIFTEVADTWSVAWGRCSSAAVLNSAHRYAEALEEYRAAIAVFRDIDDRDSEAVALTGMGQAHAAMGDPDRARTHLGAALDILTSVDDPRADDVEALIARLP